MKAYSIIQLLMMIIFMISCNDSENEEDHFRTSVSVQFSLHTVPLIGDINTRSGSLLPNELTDEEEKRINDLTVLQFDGNGEPDNRIVVVRYFENGLNDVVTVGLMQPKTDPNKPQFLVFVANANKELGSFTGTYGELCAKMIEITTSQAFTGGLVMKATQQLVVTNSLSQISITLERMMAKVKFTYDATTLPDGTTFIPTKLQLFRVPGFYSLGVKSVPFPDTDPAVFVDYPPVTTSVGDGYVWYIPENYRGTGSATSAQNKTGKVGVAPFGQELYCSYIELTGVCSVNGTDQMVSYKCYLGKDNISDYNVEKNRVYNVHFALKGFDTADKRIAVTTFPDAESSGANCYMVGPDESFCFNPYLPAGVDVSSSGVTYAEQVGTDKDNSKIQSIGVYWQTSSGLLSEVMYLSGTGSVFVKAHPTKTGNAVVAAYSGPNQTGNILWSWHIWVTDYKPNVSPVTGGAIHTYGSNGFKWMDRNLGATYAYTEPPGLGSDPNIGNSYGLIYQFGRKDPFPGCDGKSPNTVIPLYASDGITRLNLNPSKVGNSDVGYNVNPVSVKTTIENPLVFNGNTAWTTATVSKNWWGVSSAGKKVVFDPCPAGWCVPYSKNGVRAFAGVTGTKSPSDWNKNNYSYNTGYWINQEAWYPTQGWRIGAEVAKAGITGFWFAADFKSGSTYYQMVIEYDRVSNGENPPGYGFSVRCIKVDNN